MISNGCIIFFPFLGSLIFDNYLPSMYTFKGVACHSLHDTEGAENAFLQGVTYIPGDSRAWINLGESRTHLFKMNLAIEAFTQAEALGEMGARSRLLKAKVLTSIYIYIYYLTLCAV